MADVNKRQSQVIAILLPGFGHWSQGKWPLWKSLAVFGGALIAGAFTLGIGYVIIGLIDAATL